MKRKPIRKLHEQRRNKIATLLDDTEAELLKEAAISSGDSVARHIAKVLFGKAPQLSTEQRAA